MNTSGLKKEGIGSKDKDEIFAKIRAKGYKTEHEPELVNLTTSVRSNATLLYELYSDEWESGW